MKFNFIFNQYKSYFYNLKIIFYIVNTILRGGQNFVFKIWLYNECKNNIFMRFYIFIEFSQFISINIITVVSHGLTRG